ncbi:MAG: hypothetical protein O9272_10075 [Brevundimonas sp.]|jgi:hypothetical protein|nr:hypothetical protein [Brevundimonas sp.]
MAARPILAGLALASSLALAGQTMAQTPGPIATRTMPVAGTVPNVCTMDRGRVQPGGLINITGLDGDTLRIQQLTDPQTLAARSASATISFVAMCNFPHQIRLESQNNGLWPVDARVASITPGFASALPYRADVAWGQTTGSLEANATVRAAAEQRITVNGASVGDLRLRVELQQGASNGEANAPVVAGIYTDTLRIYLEPR